MATDPLNAELETIRERFRRFGPEQARGPHGSPLYEALCAGLADDPETCALLLDAPQHQRIPNLLFAAVHDLLLAGGAAARDPLADYYPTVVGSDAQPPDAEAAPRFAAFCRTFKPAVLQRLRTRSTQTNEPARASALIPALGLVANEAGRPLALLEAGASAGLLLVADRYRLRYDGLAAGPADAAVVLACRLVGSGRPPLPAMLPVAWRAGIDRDPVDLHDPARVRWLRACLWPEHRERARRLDAAVRVALAEPPRLERGDMVDDLPALAATAPEDAALTVFHATALVYLDAERRRDFIEMIRDLAVRHHRSVWLVSFEADGLLRTLGRSLRLDLLRDHPAVRPAGPACGLVAWRFAPDGTARHRLLGLAHPHGHWLEWVANGLGRGTDAG